MGALAKNPAWLIAAVFIGLLVFAGRKGGGDTSTARLSAAIQSQEISSRANVALSDITAKRDVGLAGAFNDRTRIAAGYQIDAAKALTTARAVTYSHAQAMAGISTAARLGELEINTARDVAMREMGTRVALAQEAGRMQQAALNATGNLAVISSQLQRDIFDKQAALSLSPERMTHIERLFSMDVDRSKALAAQAASSAAQLAEINAQTQRYLSNSSSRNNRADAETDIFGSVIEAAIPIAAAFFSDERLKRDVIPAGSTPDGLPWYAFRYFWEPALHFGVMAQDLLTLRPGAVRQADNGYLMVDYSQVS